MGRNGKSEAVAKIFNLARTAKASHGKKDGGGNLDRRRTCSPAPPLSNVTTALQYSPAANEIIQLGLARRGVGHIGL